MTKADLIDIVAKKGHITKRAANEVVDIFLDEIKRTLARGEKVVISGFGTFHLSKIKEKEVVPFGNEVGRTTIKSHRVVNFRVGQPLKKTVW